MDLSLIRKLGKAREGGLKQLALDAGVSEQNLHRCINANRIQAQDLEVIAKLLNVRVGMFFGEEPSEVPPDSVEERLLEYQREISRLKAQLSSIGGNTTKVVIELDVDNDEFIKMGLKEKVIRVLNKK